MNRPVIPPCHVLRIKRDGGRIELELMRFLTINEMKARRPRHYQGRSWPADVEALREALS